MQGNSVSLGCRQLELRALPSNTPLPDLGPGLYQGFAGGLYPNGSAVPPVGHRAAGLTIAQNEIMPLTKAGQPDLVNGKIVVVSVGMSNTTQEFGSTANSFKVRADQDNSKNPQVVIVDGAQGGQAADAWVSPTAPTWATLQNRLTNAGVSAQQVQLAWIKQADRQPHQYGAFPAHAQHLQGEMESIVRNLKTLFPNIHIAYVSGRTMSYNNVSTGLNPEPFAYESSFATQWMIGKQIAGDASLNYDLAAGAVVAPYLTWGPYLWSDGTNPRSDGLTWMTSDLKTDLTHPSDAGVLKVSDQLLSFFKTEPTAASWFLRSTVVGQPPTATPTADVVSGVAPLTVHFDAQAADADGTIRETAWTFDDGTFAKSATPTKTFKTPGTFTVHLAVVDNAGNAVSRSVTIQVTAPPPPTVASVQVNGGAVQRSRVTNVSIVFNSRVNLPVSAATAFQLRRQSDNAAPAFAAAVDNSGTGTVVTLTFGGATAVNAGSLADGRYTLTVDAAIINNVGGLLDGNGDGTAGDNYVLVGDPTVAPKLYRIFGDVDGDNDVDAGDFGAFRAAFGTASTIFDFDNDGDVDTGDFGQFRGRFGTSV